MDEEEDKNNNNGNDNDDGDEKNNDGNNDHAGDENTDDENNNVLKVAEYIDKSNLWKKKNEYMKMFLNAVCQEEKHDYFLPGIENKTNYCYINVYFQLLFYNPILGLQYLNELKKPQSEDKPLKKHMIEMLMEMKFGTKKTITNHLKEDFADEQIDFRDFVTDLKKKIGINSDILSGIISTKDKCRQCNGESEGSEDINDGLFSMFDYSFSLQYTEIIEKRCSNCEKNISHDRDVNYNIFDLPYFEVNVARKRILKKKKEDNFEKKIAKYEEIITIGNSTYELTTIIKKIGTVYKGHWVAIVKDWDTGQWWEMNDSRVKKCDDIRNKSITTAAINLFYVNTKYKEKATQDFENDLEELFQRYLKTKSLSYYNMNAVKSIFRKENLFLYVPTNWLTSDKKTPLDYIKCNCVNDIKKDGIYVPFIIIDNILKNIHKDNDIHNLYNEKHIIGNICTDCINIMIPTC
jgi:hypothetical protein